MKITKAQLNSIIQEELAGVLHEVNPLGAFGFDLGAVDAAKKKVGEWWSGAPGPSKKEKAMAKIDAPKDDGAPEFWPHKGGGKEAKKSLGGLMGSASPVYQWYRTGEAEGSVYPGQETRDYIKGDVVNPEAGFLTKARSIAGMPARAVRAAAGTMTEPFSYATGLAAQEMAAHTAEDYKVGEPGSQQEKWNEWRHGTTERQSEAAISGIAKIAMDILLAGAVGEEASDPAGQLKKAKSMRSKAKKGEKVAGAEGGVKGKLAAGAEVMGREVAKKAPYGKAVWDAVKLFQSREDERGWNAKEGTPQKVSYDIKTLTIKNGGSLKKKEIGGPLLSELSRNPEVAAAAYAMGMIEDDALEHILLLSKEGLSGQALAAANKKDRQQRRPGVWDPKTNRMVAYDDSVEKREKTRIAQRRALKKGGEQMAMKEEIDRVLYASVIKGNW